jgi:hypothetical protein
MIPISVTRVVLIKIGSLWNEPEAVSSKNSKNVCVCGSHLKNTDTDKNANAADKAIYCGKAHFL